MMNRILGFDFASLDRQVQEGNNMETTIDGRTKLVLELILTNSHTVGYFFLETALVHESIPIWTATRLFNTIPQRWIFGNSA